MVDDLLVLPTIMRHHVVLYHTRTDGIHVDAVGQHFQCDTPGHAHEGMLRGVVDALADMMKQEIPCQHMQYRGVYLPGLHTSFMWAVHSEKDVDKIIDAFKKSLVEMGGAFNKKGGGSITVHDGPGDLHGRSAVPCRSLRS